MTGGFCALEVGSSSQAVNQRVCSESTRVMSCLVVLFLLNTLQNGRGGGRTRLRQRASQLYKQWLYIDLLVSMTTAGVGGQCNR